MDERLNRLFKEIYTPIAAFEVTAYITDEPLPYSQRMNGEKRALSEGERWGKLWDCAWMNMKATVPVGTDHDKLAFIFIQAQSQSLPQRSPSERARFSPFIRWD